MRWRTLTILSLVALMGIVGWRSLASSPHEALGRPAVSLDLTATTREPGKIKLAGAGNEHLFFLVEVEGASPSLQAALENRVDSFEGNFFQVVTVPPQAVGTTPPDALLPLGEEYPGPDPLPLWVSLKIAPTCPPGTHTLNLIITDRGKHIRLPLEVKVFRFVLPQDLPLTIFAGFWHQPGIWPQFGVHGRDQEVRVIKSYYRSLRDYKVNALGGSYPLPLNRIHPGQRIEEFTTYHGLLRYALDELNFTYGQIPKLRGWQAAGQPESPFVRQVQVFYPCYHDYLRRHGWENRTLNYLIDEPRQRQYEAVVQAYAQAKSLLPQVKSLSAGWYPRPDFARVIDIWTYQAAHFRENDQEQGRRQGQEAWLYANRLHSIGHPLSHPRLIGWLLYRYQFSGYLLWGVNFWPRNPWTNALGPGDYQRRGTFYYPHPQTGLPVPTIRLEALRRGFQDYQYFLLLDQACRRGLISPEKQAALQARIRGFTENLPRNPFPVSMAQLEEVRLEIGHLLDRTQDRPQVKESLAQAWSRGAAFTLFISRR